MLNNIWPHFHTTMIKRWIITWCKKGLATYLSWRVIWKVTLYASHPHRLSDSSIPECLELLVLVPWNTSISHGNDILDVKIISVGSSNRPTHQRMLPLAPDVASCTKFTASTYPLVIDALVWLTGWMYWDWSCCTAGNKHSTFCRIGNIFQYSSLNNDI